MNQLAVQDLTRTNPVYSPSSIMVYSTTPAAGEWVWGGGNNGKQWCSTQTDSYGNHIEGHGYYGFCSSSCPSSYNSYNRRSW